MTAEIAQNISLTLGTELITILYKFADENKIQAEFSMEGNTGLDDETHFLLVKLEIDSAYVYSFLQKFKDFASGAIAYSKL